MQKQTCARMIHATLRCCPFKRCWHMDNHLNVQTLFMANRPTLEIPCDKKKLVGTKSQFWSQNYPKSIDLNFKPQNPMVSRVFTTFSSWVQTRAARSSPSRRMETCPPWHSQTPSTGSVKRRSATSNLAAGQGETRNRNPQCKNGRHVSAVYLPIKSYKYYNLNRSPIVSVYSES